MSEFEIDYHDVDEKQPEPFRPAYETLPLAVLEHAVGPELRKRIAEEATFALLVVAPSQDWCDAIATVIDALREWDGVFIGEHRAKKRPPGAGPARKLARGQAIVGIASSPDRQLSAAFLAAVDARVEIARAPDAAIADAIEAATGNVPASLPLGIAAGLDFNEVVAAIRMGSTPEACIERLRASSRSMTVADSTLDDVPPLERMVGFGKAHEWGMRLVGDLNAWRAGNLPFSQIDKCVVLASPPGLGKSTYVRALAKSANLPLFVSSVASWFNAGDGYLNSVLREAESVFSTAASAAPAIVFLDEIDSLPSRQNAGRNRDFWAPVIAQILMMLDGATSGLSSRLVVIGATNHPEFLDPALIRPGRLGRVIPIEHPSADDLAQIMRQHLGEELNDVDLASIARVAGTATGAMVVAWVRDARALAREAGRPMEASDLLAQVAPPETGAPEDLRRLAVHEAGHAVLAHRLVPGSVLSLSLVSRGDVAGEVAVTPNSKRSPTLEDLEIGVVTALAGRAAEIVVFGQPSTGAGGGHDSDLAFATRTVAGIHMSLGLGPSLLHLADLSRAADALRAYPSLHPVVSSHLASLQEKALELALHDRAAIERVAAELLEHRFMDGTRFLAVVCGPGR